MKCPFCGYANIAGSDECESCQADLRSLDGISIPKTKFIRILMEDPLSKIGPKEAICVSEETSVLEAVRKMNEIKAGCVLIEDNRGNLSGIMTERDILFRTEGEVVGLSKVKVSQLMTPHVETLSEDASLAYALNKMSVRRVRHIPVMRKGKKPGILSARDLLKYLAKHLDNAPD